MALTDIQYVIWNLKSWHCVWEVWVGVGVWLAGELLFVPGENNQF